MRFFPRRLYLDFTSPLDKLFQSFNALKNTPAEQKEIAKHNQVVLKRDPYCHNLITEDIQEIDDIT
jgi:hypothetical protein